MGDLSSVDPLLGALMNNGGAPATHALLAGSAASDRIPQALCLDVDNSQVRDDQRGVSRPTGALCDIGAFERGVPAAMVLPLGCEKSNRSSVSACF